jgi:hypothetical protein
MNALHSATMHPLHLVRSPGRWTAPMSLLAGRSGLYATERENARRSLVRASLGGQSIDAVAAGSGLDRSKVGKLLRGALEMTTRMAERLAAAADEPMRSALFDALDVLDRCETGEEMRGVTLGAGKVAA